MSAIKLVNRAKKGNKKALVKLIMAEKDDYYRLAFTYVKNKQDAMDAISEMTVILYEKIGQLQKVDAFYSWSKTILVNRCKTLLRNRQKVIFVEDYIAVNGEEMYVQQKDRSYRKSENRMDIDVMLAVLSDEQREVIQLKYLHDLDYETIANITNVSIGTVKSRMHYGMKKLKDHYGSEDDE